MKSYITETKLCLGRQNFLSLYLVSNIVNVKQKNSQKPFAHWLCLMTIAMVRNYLWLIHIWFVLQRPTPRLAADVAHLLLWAPPHRLLPGNQWSVTQVKWWVITMATEVHFAKSSTMQALKKCFLESFNMNRLVGAFELLGVRIVDRESSRVWAMWWAMWWTELVGIIIRRA